MTFSMKEPVGVIKFEVFDWDRFKYDDKMGHAFLDLQPVAAATKLRRALRLTAGETKLRKVALDVDNCLLSDSFVMYANGEVAVDAWLRLRDVESVGIDAVAMLQEHEAPCMTYSYLTAYKTGKKTRCCPSNR
ncbi:protein C2-DOMAIN ABA-RELATED 11-like isoform X2 [Panicum virgatum]|uniref:protein C2-DOMAIN ABA-RELATED 11-like isoform X2 n=1 Tax=Panicum virgatum TaxID=38727 RepID=UPI0019D60923|nr:protein C2-DOMAIN ABA-RELATED 11-like isoform X2 [Panicum virgatum]